MDTKVSSKGQVVLPKSLRQDLDWQSGTALEIERQADGVFLRRKGGIRPTTIEEVAGRLKYDGPPISLKDMERGTESALRERWRRKSR